MNRYSRAAGYILFIAGSSLSVWLGTAAWGGYDTHSWQEAKGIIYQSQMIEKTRRGSEVLFAHQLIYRYQYLGGSFAGEQVYRTDLPISSERHLEQLIEQFPIGSIQTVYVNPDDHSEAVLQKGASIQLLLALVFALACFGLGILSFRKLSK
ncbi:MAG: hypothetical protein ACJAYE_002024 [Candidatus Azotimanducaceae bacterium]|jgi:hypothetical protein